ncbi:MAG: hypothetical protein JXR95_10485 [Deltaproteobacteria bacterium]|nr:hypothetical protein [Deltaproteobacteria bacterium]
MKVRLIFLVTSVLLVSIISSCDDSTPEGSFVDTPLNLGATTEWDNESCGIDIYPCPPYGTRLYQTVRDIPFLGANEAAMDIADNSGIAHLQYFYKLYEQGYQMLMISTTTGWCEHCAAQMDTMPQMVELYGHLSDDPQVAFLVVVEEDEALEWASLDFAGEYSDLHNMGDSVPVTNDPGGSFYQLMTSTSYPFNLYIDLSDMTIFAYSSALETVELFSSELDDLLSQLEK